MLQHRLSVFYHNSGLLCNDGTLLLVLVLTYVQSKGQRLGTCSAGL